MSVFCRDDVGDWAWVDLWAGILLNDYVDYKQMLPLKVVSVTNFFFPYFLNLTRFGKSRFYTLIEPWCKTIKIWALLMHSNLLMLSQAVACVIPLWVRVEWSWDQPPEHAGCAGRQQQQQPSLWGSPKGHFQFVRAAQPGVVSTAVWQSLHAVLKGTGIVRTEFQAGTGHRVLITALLWVPRQCHLCPGPCPACCSMGLWQSAAIPAPAGTWVLREMEQWSNLGMLKGTRFTQLSQN